jgi:uncharacterized protein
MALELELLPDRFAACRLASADPVPAWVPAAGSLVVLARTSHELSIVCDGHAVPDDVRAERGYCAFVVRGALPFDAIGIIAGITSVLAAAEIPVLAISTFDTDYVLVHERHVDAARGALRVAGYGVA